ncbi:MAG: hypothetical protein QOK29_4620 [Rhodospirillaceae bacterium]|nr:hypothetical protein [Rhodospirillaceae bacterium]
MPPLRALARPSQAQVIARVVTLLLILPSISLLFGLAAPLMTKRLPSAGLTGMVAPQRTQVRFTWDAWLSGDLQSGFDAWFANNLGPARRILVRLNNGIYYLAFHRSALDNADIVIGKQRVLYQGTYVRDACGKGGSLDTARLERSLHAASRALNDRRIAFAMAISPSKAAIYPEFIPAAHCTMLDTRRAYDQLVPLITAGDLPIIDGHAITTALRAATPWPVFPRDGTHWNHLGALATVEALIDTLEQQLGRRLVHLNLERVDVDDHPTGSDADLGHLLNLPFPLRPYPTPHAVIGHDGGGRPIHVLFVGSSFLWIPIEILMRNGVISDSTGYFYDNRIFRIGKDYRGDLEGLADISSASAAADLAKRINEVDAVVLEVNEAFLGDPYVVRFLGDIVRLSGSSQAAEPRIR